MKTWTTNVMTVEEFRKHLLECLAYGSKDYTKEQLFELLLDDGFPKFDVEDLGKFMNGLQCRVFLDPVCVDFGDSMFYWLVSGTSAILVKKTI